jgi:hypothetical protein
MEQYAKRKKRGTKIEMEVYNLSKKEFSTPRRINKNCVLQAEKARGHKAMPLPLT